MAFLRRLLCLLSILLGFEAAAHSPPLPTGKGTEVLVDGRADKEAQEPSGAARRYRRSRVDAHLHRDSLLDKPQKKRTKDSHYGFGSGEIRTEFLRPRDPVAAACLGGLVGFGTGFLYAGDQTKGLVLAAVDSTLWITLAASMTVLTQLVVRHDMRSNRSLRQDERPFGQRERFLYRASWGAAGLLAVSHVFQGIAGWQAAKRTNRILANYAFVPLGAAGGTRP